MKKYLLFLLPLLGLSLQLHAGIIWENSITDTNPSATNPYTNGQTVAANLSVSGIFRGSGLAASSALNRFSASGWTTGASLDSSDYFSFTLTPAAGFQLNLENFAYGGQRSTTGPSTFAFRSSLDGFSSNIGTANESGITLSLTGAQFQGLTGSIEFRFYGFGATAAGGTYSINEFNFNGTLDQLTAGVPESSPGLVVFAGTVLLLALARQRVAARA